MSSNNVCVVCGGITQRVWDLPSLPLTGIYLDSRVLSGYQYDQALEFCESCSHAQLAKHIDPIELYRATYDHRTSRSLISVEGNDFLINFLRTNLMKSDYSQILEIGCNDLYLLESLDDLGAAKSGVDPIWNNEFLVREDGIRLSGEFAEVADYGKLLVAPIDLLISSHTFEHIPNPRKVFEKLQQHLSENCEFFIEVPSANRMIAQGRMDQVFSQHVNYFSTKSLCELVAQYGFQLCSLTHNFSYWGGTQLLHFARGSKAPSNVFQGGLKQIGIRDYVEAIAAFKAGLLASGHQIESTPGRIVGYGAAQMLPILEYHFRPYFSTLDSILDDNPLRCGKYYPCLSLEIKAASIYEHWNTSTVVVTALDSSRKLVRSAIRNEARSIIVPMGIC